MIKWPTYVLNGFDLLRPEFHSQLILSVLRTSL